MIFEGGEPDTPPSSADPIRDYMRLRIRLLTMELQHLRRELGLPPLVVDRPRR